MKVPYIREREPEDSFVRKGSFARNHNFVQTYSSKKISDTYSAKEIQAGIDYLTSLINGKIGMIDKHDLEALGIEYSNCRGIIKFCEQEALAVLHRLMLAKKKAG